MRSDFVRRCVATLAVLSVAAAIPLPPGTIGAQEANRTAISQREAMGNVSGPELIRRLSDAKSRMAAFRELVSRSGDGWSEKLNSAEVIVCPQGTDEKPIYIVLTTRWYVTDAGGGSWFTGWFSGYRVEKPEELFGPPPEYPERPIPPHGRLDRRGGLIIYAFTADGRRITPFGGDNMLYAGIIVDMNGDGNVERADMMNCFVWGVAHAMVVEVCTVAEHPRPLLRVLYNWGSKNDWDYQFADRDGDGRIEIEFGPVIAADVVKPKVVFAWDQAKDRYTAARGGDSPHLRVLPWTDYNDHKILWRQLGQFKREKLTFPVDPEAKDTGRTAMVGIGGDRRGGDALEDENPSPPPAEPYRRATLKGLTNPQIVAYMGRGKMSWDYDRERVVPTRLPQDFWTLPAKQAAAALVEINRTEKHRRKYRLAIDDRDGRQPPDACSIRYSHRPHRSLFTCDLSYFLRVDAEKAYLTYAGTTGRRVRPSSIVADQPTYDLRYAALSWKDGKHVADVIWWLRHVRTWNPFEDSSRGMSYSSADGRGALRLHSPRGVEVEVGGRVWACDAISERWQGHFVEETLVNFIDYLLQNALPSRLGEQWARQEPSSREGWRRLVEMKLRDEKEAKSQAQREQELAQQYRRQVGPFIGLYSADESRLPYSMLRIAVDAAGDSTLTEFRPPLQTLLGQLTTAKRPAQAGEEVTSPAERPAGGENPGKGDAGEDVLDLLIKEYGSESPKSAALREEFEAGTYGAGPKSAREQLRSAAILALHKLTAADDAGKLQAWAQTALPGWQWAMARLKKIDKSRYVAALESWLHRSKGPDARQFFEAIQRANPPRAAELARQLPPDRKSDLRQSAESVSERANAIHEADRRVDALIAVMLDRSKGWQQRTQAIEFLVPDEAPLKYPDRKVDEALLRLFDRGRGDSIVNFTLASACHALAMRGRIEYFDRMLQRFNEEKEGEARSRMRMSLVHLALRGTEDERAKLSAVLGASLKQTGPNPSDAILGLYALDRREWKDELERIATSRPEDYEGRQPLPGADTDEQAVYRSHDARKIAAIWNEDDSLTRAKLLLAFGFQVHCSSWRDEGERFVSDTIQKQLRESAGGLSPEQARGAVEFVDYCEKNADHRFSNGNQFADLARKVLAAIPASPKDGSK